MSLEERVAVLETQLEHFQTELERLSWRLWFLTTGGAAGGASAATVLLELLR